VALLDGLFEHPASRVTPFPAVMVSAHNEDSLI
jgi:hypothetical protein